MFGLPRLLKVELLERLEGWPLEDLPQCQRLCDPNGRLD